MADALRKLILSKCPNYDFDRYRFKFGDIVKTLDGATILVKYSALEYVEAFVLKPSFSLRKNTFQHVPYSNLPNLPKDGFESLTYPVQKKIKWSVGDIVIDSSTGMKLLLVAGENQNFHGLVLETDLGYYKETAVFIRNPYRDYIRS